MDDPADIDGASEPEGWVHPDPLHCAARNGNLKAVRHLVAEGCNVNACDSGTGRTPLHWAAMGEHLDVVAFLLAAGADVNAVDARSIGYPPLTEVAQTCSLQMAKLLIAAGADPMLQVGRCRTALEEAAERKRFEGPQVYALFVEAAGRLGHVVGKPKRRR